MIVVPISYFMFRRKKYAPRFDVSLAGMGGCPVIPNAKGNIPTEDFVNLLHKMDIGCGIDLDRCTVASLDMSRRPWG